jgi:MFS transporter, DHA2 family, multidrug resistance protein
MNKWIVAITVMLPTLIQIIDSSVVNVALDHIRGSLSAGIDEATWAITIYIVASAIVIPITGWLSRIIGRKLYLNISLVLFTISSLLCGLAWNIQSLCIFRVFQGLGGGGLQPLSMAILLETFPRREHGMAMAIYGMGIGFGPIAGPLMGGWITDNWSWHWIFFINIPIGIISMIMVMLFIEDPPYMKRTRMKIDYPGIILIALGLGCLQVMLDQGQRKDWFSSAMITWLAIVAAVSLALFFLFEIRSKEPVINLSIFKSASFSAGSAIAFSSFFCMYASMVMLPIYLQTLMGYTATLSGWILAPGGITAIAGSFISGKLSRRVNGKVTMACALLAGSYSVWAMSRFNLSADFWALMMPRLILGLAVGFILVPVANLTLSGIGKRDMGNATAQFSFVRNIGASFGVALTTTILARRAQFHQASLVGHLTPFDTAYQVFHGRIESLLHYRGFADGMALKGADGLIYRELVRQAMMLSFNDVFFLLSILFLCAVPLVFLLKVAPYREGAGGEGGL